MNFQRKLRGGIGLAAMMAAAICPNPARAELAFAKPAVDLGQIRIGQTVEHKFVFTNTGPGAAVPVDVQASCGCLRPIIELRNFQPGETGKMLLKINTLSSTPGPHSWTLKVRYRQGEVLYEVPLAVSAYVIQELSVQPPAMAIYAVGAVQHQLTITDLRAASFKVLKVEGTSPHMEVSVAEEGIDPLGRTVRRINLKVAEAYPEGQGDQQVVIHTDDPIYKEIRVPVQITKRSENRFIARPNKVDLVASANQTNPARILTIKDNQGKPVIIDKIDMMDPAVTCEWAPGANAYGTIKVAVDKTKITGETLNTKIQVRFRSATNESLIIPVSCAVR